jgi:hypothetical protein
MSRPSRTRVTGIVTLAAILAAWLLLRGKQPAEPAAVSASAPIAAPAPAVAEPLKLASGPRPAAVQGLPHLSLLPEADASVEDTYRARMAETRAALLEKTRYPLDSRPLAMKTDLLLPHHVDPLVRGLASPGRVVITQQQDRVFVAPGQPAVVSISAKAGGQPVSLDVASANVLRHLDGQPDSSVGQVAFADNGQAPDEIASDGTYTGLVSTPTDGTGASLTLTVEARAAGESGVLTFEFVQTASAPAVFTQTARDALEQGSVAVYVGVQVQRPGTYEIQGRLYDSTGAPIAYMRFLDTLTTASKEVRLYAFGKVILDEGGVPPFVLRDVEGWRMAIGEYPDRELMTDWPAGYTTAKYALSQLSGADYDGPDKQRKIAALTQAEAEGINNIRNGPSATPPAPAR